MGKKEKLGGMEKSVSKLAKRNNPLLSEINAKISIHLAHTSLSIDIS